MKTETKHLQKYHLTKDGATTLCGLDGMKIHITYADRILDCGQWCDTCQAAIAKATNGEK
jgi:hypothetical protein